MMKLCGVWFFKELLTKNRMKIINSNKYKTEIVKTDFKSCLVSYSKMLCFTYTVSNIKLKIEDFIKQIS